MAARGRRPQQTKASGEGGSKYLTERVHGVERNRECAKGSRKDQAESMEEINVENRHAVVLGRTCSEAEHRKRRRPKGDPPHRF